MIQEHSVTSIVREIGGHLPEDCHTDHGLHKILEKHIRNEKHQTTDRNCNLTSNKKRILK